MKYQEYILLNGINLAFCTRQGRLDLIHRNPFYSVWTLEMLCYSTSLNRIFLIYAFRCLLASCLFAVLYLKGRCISKYIQFVKVIHRSTCKCKMLFVLHNLIRLPNYMRQSKWVEAEALINTYLGNKNVLHWIY